MALQSRKLNTTFIFIPPSNPRFLADYPRESSWLAIRFPPATLGLASYFAYHMTKIIEAAMLARDAAVTTVFREATVPLDIQLLDLNESSRFLDLVSRAFRSSAGGLRRLGS